MLFSDGFAFSRTAARCQSLLKTEESTHTVDVDARQLTRETASRHLHAALNGRLRTRHKMIGQENLQSAFCKTAKTPDDINSQVIAAISIQSSSLQSTFQNHLTNWWTRLAMRKKLVKSCSDCGKSLALSSGDLCVSCQRIQGTTSLKELPNTDANYKSGKSVSSSSQLYLPSVRSSRSVLCGWLEFRNIK